MHPITCHPQMPVVKAAYFAAFDPAALALICEATLLQGKLGVMAGVSCGLIWAAIRAIERGEAQCPALAGFTSKAVEESYRTVFRKLPGRPTPDRIEKTHGMNLLVVLPPRCKPTERRLDFSKPVTPGILLTEIIAKFDYTHGTNLPLHRPGLEMRELCEALTEPQGFVSGEKLIARGTIAQTKRPLYELACEKAAFVGTWLVRDIHLAAAAEELGIYRNLGMDVSDLLQRWEKEVKFAQDHVSGGGCVFLCAFPGPRPWTPSACPFLGVRLPSIL